MLLELHTHTDRYSRCSTIDPVTLVKRVVAKGIQGIVITEHHYLWSDEEIARLRAEAEVGSHFRIFAAQEVETDLGHVLVYGAHKSIKDFIRIADLRAAYPSAALVWAHPYRKGHMPTAGGLLNPLFDGIEVFSLNHTMRENYIGLRDWHIHKFTAVSGSDTHSAANAGIFPTLFDHNPMSVMDLAAEIKNRRCRPFIKEIPKSGSGLLVTEITIGTKGEDEQRHRIIIKEINDDKKWKKTKESARLTESLCAHGFAAGRFRVPRLIEINDAEQLLIEEGQRGKNLYDLLLAVTPKTGAAYLSLAGQWLARLHTRPAGARTDAELLKKEAHRFTSYGQAFTTTNNPHRETVARIIKTVEEFERAIIGGPHGHFVQCHGDYHPKNIIIGQDLMHDPDTQFISVIDFNSEITFSPAFDVGYFLAQFAGQFSAHPDVLREYSEDLFLDAYLKHVEHKDSAFNRQVPFFTLRGNLSIAAYLIKVGKGESVEMDGIIARSRALMKEL